MTDGINPYAQWLADQMAMVQQWITVTLLDDIAAAKDDDILKPLAKTPKKPALQTGTTWRCSCGKTVLYTIKYCPNCGNAGLFGA